MELLTTIQGRKPLWVVSFVTTAMSSLIWPVLPAPIILPLLFVVALFIIKFPTGLYFSGGLFGIVWMASVGHWQVSWQLPTQEIRQIQQVTGSIESIVHPNGPVRFNLRILSIDGKQLFSAPIVRLSWRQPVVDLKQGQKVKLDVKLKPIHGLANQGGFGYQQWLIANRIVATGYVRQSSQSILLDKEVSTRQRYIDEIHSMALKHGRWIIALSLGERGQFNQQDWQLLQQTGTAHLMAISGLHLSIVASLSYVLFGVLFSVLTRFFQVSQSFNYQVLILGLVCLSTMFYALLAGFALPTLRAWIMLLLWALLIGLCRYVRPFYFLLYCVFFFLLISPLSILSASYWLSFSAVFAIAIISWRWSRNIDRTQSTFLRITVVLKQVVVLQLALSLLLSPVVAGFFSLFVPSSSIINLVAIPVVTFVLVPVCLLGVLLLSFSYDASFAVFNVADIVLDTSIDGLNWFQSQLPSVIELPGAPTSVWLFVISGLLMLMLPIGWKCKFSASILFMPFLSHLLPTRSQQWHLHTLDVGHGLAIVIERAGRSLVYDVGASFKSGFNMADSVLLPFLHFRGISSIDRLFISHSDNDHAGALPIVLNNIDVGTVLTNQGYCNASFTFHWRGLDIKGLWPHSQSPADGNDHSCVLIISDGQHTALLPGDISSQVEQTLVQTYGSKLASDVLIASHHGSQTSSAEEFVEAVNPTHVIFSHGQHAQWDFPAQAVVNRFEQVKSSMHSTSESGQVSVTFNGEGELPIVVRRYRDHMMPVWYNQSYGLAESQ